MYTNLVIHPSGIIIIIIIIIIVFIDIIERPVRR